MKKHYTTGAFAKLAKVSERTIRYYDQQGLLKPSFLMENRYRCYVDEDFMKIQKIITLKYLGFSLGEIKLMLLEEDEAMMQSSLDVQIAMLDKKMKHMSVLKDALLSAKKKLAHKELDWNELSTIMSMNEEDEKIIEHYQNAHNLTVRIHLHEVFSVNPQGWYAWVMQQIDFQHITRLLEVGCGNGAIWHEFKLNLRNREFFLSDLSQGMIETARQELGDDFSYMDFDCQKIPFKKMYFDAVLANHMLFYVNDVEKGISEIARVLKSSGTLYCSAYGPQHMKEITTLVQEFDPEVVLSSHELSERFGLHNGEAMLRNYFKDVKKVMYEDALEIREEKPLFDYIMSCHGNQSERLSNRLEEFQNFLNERLQRDGVIRVKKEVGLFIAKEKKIPEF